MANIQGFGIQLATGGFSLEANTIFATYAEALAYAQSSAAYVGKVISVTSGDNKGLYTIEAVGVDAAFKKVGSDIDLSNYITSTTFNSTLNDYAKKTEIGKMFDYKGSVNTVGDLENLTEYLNDEGAVFNVKTEFTIEDEDGNPMSYPAGTNVVRIKEKNSEGADVWRWDTLGGTFTSSALDWEDVE